jgi:hypothetical protein
MNRMILAVSFIACAAEAAPRHRATMPPQFPPCRTIEGTPAVTFTRDGGATVAPRARALHGIGYTYGVAALDGQTIQDFGTDLWRFDAALGDVRLMHHDFDDIDAIAFSPADPSVMYFGLEVVEPNGP